MAILDCKLTIFGNHLHSARGILVTAYVRMLKERESLDRGGASPFPGVGSGSLDVTSCAGCGGRIHDRYYLLAVDRQWHAHCLKCCECKLPLDSELTCFARDGNIYCKEDYYR